MDRRNLEFLVGAFAIALLSASVFVFSADAQTNRRRTTAKSRPAATPTPRSTEPEIISRADDYPTVVIEPPPTRKGESSGDIDSSSQKIEELRERLARLERSSKKDPDEKQRRLALNLEILTRSEQRSDGLRKQLFEMIEKENSIKGRIDQIDVDARPESIDRQFATVGSLRPEELRAQRRKSLELEKANLQILLTEVQKNRANIDLNLQRSDALVERLRVKLEKEIDTALADDPLDKPEDR